jgi:hypothetical protein
MTPTSKLQERVQRLAPAIQDSRPRLGTVGGTMRQKSDDDDGAALAAFVVLGRI